MGTEINIALRYIFSKRSFNFITVVTFISILGITAGTAALIAVLSIFNGFQELTIKQIVGFDPHIRISAKAGNSFSIDDSLLAKFNKSSEILAVAPLIQGKAIAINGSSLQAFNVFGFNKGYKAFNDEIAKSIVVGKFNFDYGDFGKGIIIGSALADRLGIFVGETFTILSPDMIENSFRTYSQPSGETVYVAAIFQTNIKDYDLSTAFIEDKLATKLFTLPTNRVTNIDIRLKDFSKAQTFASNLEKQLGNDYAFATWIDLNKDLYQVMRFEKMASFAVIGLIIIIAVFNVLSSLAMTVTEKKQDIGLLKAIGANDSFITKVFLYEGIIIGMIGTVLGAIIGFGIVLSQEHFKLFAIDSNKYIIDAIPVSINLVDIITVLSFSMLLSLLATIYPAVKASRTVVITAIRGE